MAKKWKFDPENVKVGDKGTDYANDEAEVLDIVNQKYWEQLAKWDDTGLSYFILELEDDDWLVAVKYPDNTTAVFLYDGSGFLAYAS